MVGLLDDPGDGLKVVAAIFGDEDVRRGLSSDTESSHRLCWEFHFQPLRFSVHPVHHEKGEVKNVCSIPLNGETSERIFPCVSHLALLMFLLGLSSLAVSECPPLQLGMTSLTIYPHVEDNPVSVTFQQYCQ